ncbi:MAG TPA: hypothetical protein VK508_07550 [Cyclobacteriaceae bacterium]|nr:hypothetical protein [Cyclobacteriaceae bacterium]
MVFFAVLILSVIGYNYYKDVEKNSTRELYTVCVITGRYFTPKHEGATFEYTVDGKKLESHCTGQECFDAKVGSRFVIRYWESHPEWTYILFDKPIPEGMEIPPNGWEQIPDIPMK